CCDTRRRWCNPASSCKSIPRFLRSRSGRVRRQVHPSEELQARPPAPSQYIDVAVALRIETWRIDAAGLSPLPTRLRLEVSSRRCPPTEVFFWRVHSPERRTRHCHKSTWETDWIAERSYQHGVADVSHPCRRNRYSRHPVRPYLPGALRE